MKRLIDTLLALAPLLLFIAAVPDASSQVAVQSVRVASGPEETRLVMDTDGPVDHRIFTLDEPDRVVIDIPDARIASRLPETHPEDPTLIGLRSGVRDGDDLRVVLDLKQPARVKSFVLTPDGSYGHRLVIDLIPKGGSALQVATAEAPRLPVRSRASVSRTAVVAIDAGHGGQDPGAIGARGTREKDVTLNIARRLAKLVEKEPGMRPVLIRDGDYFVALRQRILKAREHKADVFISIHADAFNNPKVRGSSVFTLSERGASSEAAKWLADRENSADLVGGVDLSVSDDVLANVLLNMSQNATIEHSGEAATAVLQHLGRLGDTHRAQVQKAAFVVLKSPDIPSMLVETAFITNPQEEARLQTERHQQRLAEAILAGIKAYFGKYPPQGTRLAAEAAAGEGRRYVIAGGDTLVDIAKRHSVSLSSLRTANNLTGDTIRVGQVLTIPEGG